MERWEQYEIWIQEQGQWTRIAVFADFDLASAMAAQRSTNIRLIYVVYEDGKVVKQDVLAEIGSTRQE